MSGGPSSLRQMVVDMTPLGPGGQNGGAGLVATTLVREMAAQAPDLHQTLLTDAASHAELAVLDGPNVERRCVVSHAARPRSRRAIEALLPPWARARLKQGYYRLRTARRYATLSQDVPAHVLFCPFTVPYFWRPEVPCLSIVYDLQHVRYPQFFSREQRANRQRQLQEACARSARVVCISEFVRQTVLGTITVPDDRVVTIPLGLLTDRSTRDGTVLARLGIATGEYLLYPANFWPHKNHARLFEALRLARSEFKLVCTGAPNVMMRELQAQAPSGVLFPGYVSQAELAALLDGCAALIFPSLYEGFGMPVLEAMAADKPVLCSNVTSLPEVGGDAVLYFDPTDASAMADAIDSVCDTPGMANLVARGRQRVAAFGDGRTMAARYLDVIDQVC